MRFVARSTVVRIGAGAVALSLLAGGAVVAPAALTKVTSEVQAGDYKLDSAHGKITWSVDHLGFSTYYGQFVNVKAELKLDPANPSASTLTATIPLTEVDSNSDGLNRHLQTADFFDSANHPVASNSTEAGRADNRRVVHTMVPSRLRCGPGKGGLFNFP